MPAERAFDVLVVGAGPAGMAAAVVAAVRGKAVGVVDDNLGLGGQIWRGGAERPPSREAAAWFDRIPRGRLRDPHRDPGPRPARAGSAAGGVGR